MGLSVFIYLEYLKGCKRRLYLKHVLMTLSYYLSYNIVLFLCLDLEDWMDSISINLLSMATGH
jgi:hypothetical protein